MSYLKHFGVGNFKVFNEKTNFEFAPVTILTGKNNSGKSSLIKALLLFIKNQSVRKKIDNPGDTLQFDFPELKLGSPDEIYNFENKGKSITFSFSINNEILPKGLLYLFYQVDQNDDLLKLTFFSLENDGRIVVSFLNDFLIDSFNGEKSLNIDTEYFIERLKEIIRDNPDLEKKELGKKIKLDDPINELLNRDKGNDHLRDLLDFLGSEKSILGSKVKNDNIPPELIKKEYRYLIGETFELDNADVEKLQSRFLKSLKEGVFIKNFNYSSSVQVQAAFSSSLSSFNLEKKINEIFEEDEILKLKYRQQMLDIRMVKFDINFHPLFDYIQKFVSSTLSDTITSWGDVPYLPSMRAKNERLYIVSQEGYSIQEFDKKTFENIDFKNDKINQFYLDALKDFEIGEKIDIKTYQRNSTEITIIRDGKRMLLSDLGFGYAQLLPIILRILVTASKTSLNWMCKKEDSSYSKILIEEPESNLHPDFQAKLADLFVKASNLFCIQFIIETHSEYLIRRLQYLTARKDIKPDDISIYYFNNPNNIPKGEKQISKIEIRPDGILKQDFGSGFYDQAANSTYDLFRLIGTN
jgi:predicted ATPase